MLNLPYGTRPSAPAPATCPQEYTRKSRLSKCTTTRSGSCGQAKMTPWQTGKMILAIFLACAAQQVLVDQGAPPRSRHSAAGPVAARLPLPYDLVTDCVANNNQAALLLPDNRTLVQVFVATAFVFTSADSLVVPDVLPPEARWSLCCMVSHGSPAAFSLGDRCIRRRNVRRTWRQRAFGYGWQHSQGGVTACNWRYSARSEGRALGA